MNQSPFSSRCAGLLAAAVALVAASSLRADVRSLQSFDNDWRFNKGDATGAEAATFSDAGWRQLNVPHDWSIEGPFAANAPTQGKGANAPTGVVWYRKTFTLPAGGADKRCFVDFDGIMQNSDVWINGFHLGKRPYGYVSFQYELTGHLNATGPNILAVRADTSQQPSCRWYSGGGIYRHVKLETMDPVHIDHWGTFVTTPKITAAAATVHVRSTIINQSAAPRDVTVAVNILGPDGKSVATGETKAQSVPAGKTLDFDQDVTVNSPKLWNLEDTQLYSAVASVKAGAAVIDDQTVTFGIRTAEFKADSGFWLNGKNFKLKGSCMHCEAGGLGDAVPEDEYIHRLQMLKLFGCNAVRTAHNPPSPEFLDACDKVGMLVMDEMFDCWDVAKNPYDYHLYFDQWHLIDTRDTVQRDRNHPAIILYSAGNEIHDTPNSAKAIPILQGLVKTFHENDPTRSVTQALFRPNSDNNGGAYNNGLAALLDVVGTNYRDAELLAAHRANPSIKIVGTEQGRTLAVWAQVRDHPEYSGDFIWTGVDYLGETGAYPAMGNSSGYIDITDRVKPVAYERGLWWADKPVVYVTRGGAGGGGGRGGAAPADDPGAAPDGADAGELNGDPLTFAAAPAAGAGGRAGRGGAARGGAVGAAAGAAPGAAPARGGGGGGGRGGPAIDWTPANLAAHTENVTVYSNCEQVELFLNDKSLGSKPRGAVDTVRTWAVDFAPGTLRAVGKNNGQQAAVFELKTAGPASKVALLPATTSKLYADFDSLAIVTVSITDDKGVQVPTANNMVTFTLTGPGEIAALANGSTQAQNFRGTQHAAMEGELKAYVRATGTGGPITLTATADGLAKGTVTFETAPARPAH